MDIRSAYDLPSLALALGCSARQLGFYVYRKPLLFQYQVFKIPKRRGGTRTIRAPNTNLKLIQERIAQALGDLRSFAGCVNGFVPGRDIKRNATSHVGQHYVLNIDLEDFFGSINFGRVFGVLTKAPHGLHPKVGAIIAKATTVDNKLPQGAPSSPIITNLICSKMDAELTRLAKANRCTYSRYADDLTFSTHRNKMPLATLQRGTDGTLFCEISSALRAIIETNGFRINQSKVHLFDNGNRQEVTGLIVNERVNVKRRLVREVRAMLHAWRKFGPIDAEKEFQTKYNGGSSSFEAVVRGKIGFIGYIRERPDKTFRNLAKQFNSLASGAKIRTVLSNEEIARRAVLVLEHDEGQGSAFLVEKHGLITCAHCIGSKNLHVYHPADHGKKIPVSVKSVDQHRDLAILELASELSEIEPLRLFDGTTVSDGSDAVLYGYPKHHAAKPVRIEPGKIVRSFPRSGVSYLEITPKIIEGNSGGPLLNDNFEVIGVAVKGVNGSTSYSQAEFLAVSAIELNNIGK